MAHVRVDTLVAPGEWWRHLRPYNKRKLAKAERRAADSDIGEQIADIEDEEFEFFHRFICGCGECGE